MRPKPTSTRLGPERYVEWRARCLSEAGVEPQTARSLGRDLGFDLHALLGLIDRGCPPELAVRIVAPLDWEPR